MKSLRRRLTLTLALGLLLSLLVQAALGYLTLQRTAEEQAETRLQNQAESLLAALGFSREGIPWLDGKRLDPVYERPFSGYYYLLQVKGLSFYSRSLWQFELRPPPARPEARFSQQPGPQQQRLLILTRRFTRRGQPIAISVAEDLLPFSRQLTQLSLSYIGLSLLLAVLLLGMQGLSLRRALQPLAELTRDLQGLSRGERERLNEAVPTELQPLVQAFNRQLEVLQQRHERTRNAMSNLAHAFKKPLTLLHQQVFLLEPSRRKPFEQQLLQLQQLMDHELNRARLAGPAAGAKAVDLAQEVPSLIQLLERMHAGKTVSCELRLPGPAPLAMERQDALELLGNLLDNAYKWARGRVCLEWSAEQGLMIADDGPGCEPEDLARLSQRGVRLDEQTPGHGLGLAIAREIAESYRAELVLGRSAEFGGLAVRLIFAPEV